MDNFRRDDFEALIAAHEAPCVSIFLSTHRAGQPTQQDPIRLRNLLRQAERSLVDRGTPGPVARQLLEETRSRFTQEDFWRDRTDGLAIFLSPGFSATHHVPLAFDELVVVGRRFQVVPLLPLRNGDYRFLLVAVSQNHVQLYEGDRYQLKELHVDVLPENLALAIEPHHSEGTRQHHTVVPGGRGKSAAVFHGQGGAADELKEELQTYFREVDRALHQHVHLTPAPLLFAGVDYLFPLYRAANTSPHLMEQHVSGNPDRWTPQELHDRAWPLIESLADRKRGEMFVQHRQLAGTAAHTNEIYRLIPFAREGQVESLIVAAQAHRWGRFDANHRSVHLDDGPLPGNDELINLAVIDVLSHKGQVIAVDVPELMNGEVVSAELRPAAATISPPPVSMG